jgi:hypothetical protein
MRLTFAILIAAMLGALIGIGRTMLHFGALGGERAVTAVDYPPDETEKYWSVPTDGSQPVARPDEETHHFNHMEVGATLRHTFRIHNDGQYPLVVRKSDSSCVCTVANVGGAAIPPGNAAKVTLEWTTKAGSRPGDLFRQWAEVETNDPKRRFITFTVEGEIVGSVATEQPDFVLGRVARSETRVARMKLYAFRSPEGGKLAATRVDNDANNSADVISITTAPLAAGELARERAVDGLWIQLTLKPGLPLGSIRQTIRLRTNLPGSPYVELPVIGEIVPDVYLAGPGYSERTGVLSLGRKPPGSAIERRLQLVIFGSQRKSARPAVAARPPEWLDVTIGGKETAPDNQSVRYPITVRAPADAPRNALDGPTPDRLGEVTIETGLLELAKLRLLVKVSVTE